MNTKVCPVEIFQSSFEFNPLLEYYKTLNAKNIIEIGSLFGGTLWNWLQYLQPNGKVTIVDMLVGSNDSRYSKQLDCHNKLWPEWAREVPTDLIVLEDSSMSSKTINYVHQRHTEPVDFIFIDGDHKYESVKSDFEKYVDLVRPGGLVAFHDVDIPMNHSAYGGVKDFWDELELSGKYITNKWVEIPGWWGIGALWIPQD